MQLYICSTKCSDGMADTHYCFIKSDGSQGCPVNNKQIHLTAGEMNAMKKEIRKILIGMDILCLLCVFCYPASDMGKGLVAALAADAITLVAADLYKAKER